MLKKFERTAAGRLRPLDGLMQRVIARSGFVAVAGEPVTLVGVVQWTGGAWAALLEIVRIQHATAFGKRATRAEGMVDRLTALMPDRFTSLPEGRDAEGEFAGWIDADHICFDCELFAKMPIIDHRRRVARGLRQSGDLVPGCEARPFQYRLPIRYVVDRPRTYHLWRDRFEP